MESVLLIFKLAAVLKMTTLKFQHFGHSQKTSNKESVDKAGAFLQGFQPMQTDHPKYCLAFGKIPRVMEKMLKFSRTSSKNC